MSNTKIVFRSLKTAWPVLLAVFALLIFNLTWLNPGVLAFDYPKLKQNSLTIGTTEPGATTSYTISWRYPSNTTIGSVRFVICADPYVTDTCSSTPASDFSGGVLSSQTGVTGFAIANQTASEILMTRPTAFAGTMQSTYVFDNMINPTGVHSVFYIQIFTYFSDDGTGTPSFISSVASATTDPIQIEAEVPPILYFCAALTVDDWCNSVNGNFIDYGSLDPVNGHSATSQFGVATNATGGYIVTANGNTMTSGNKKIAALTTPATYQTGEQQFGINLRANVNPALGQDVTGLGIGVVTSDYNSPDMYKFASGDTIALAASGSLFNTYTVTYILNLPVDQPSGVYNTTIAYICTASF